ncbi:hypothetical protein HQN87_20115 [Paenibacillus tritici]|uniref:Uncharacterized protein n=2 Tax=Paenibacillus tritici TaxID=1873425 RepID=A0ABX2DSR7_9BACL|nr:hypothetical protein [Paenibacillus tritici]NQX47632.1 hypothetical protein [Paenibacillus tritici]
MAEVVGRLGIVPLASLIPEHPSVNGLTLAENWHTDTELDPWGWRVRFPGEGLAGYGKFIKKKAVLVSRGWLPAYLAAAGPQQSLEERYESGLATREALTLLQIIRANEGIETRQLRSIADMKAKEKKTAFDNAVTELQGSLDIVISGVKQRLNADGEPNGWNSTSFETAGHWMKEAGIQPFEGTREEAVTWLRSGMDGSWAPEAIAWISKVHGWK